MAKDRPDSDEVVKYLGFGVHPGKIEEFWKSEEEKKLYLQRVKSKEGQTSVLERDAALLNVKLMSGVDKTIGIIGSILLVISFFLPVYSFDIYERHLSGSAISFFANMPLAGGYASWGGAVMVLTLAVLALIILSCPVAGVLNIIGLTNKNKGDEYFATLKKYSRFIFVPMALYLLLFLLLIMGAPQPFGSLGVGALGESLDFGAIFKMTGIGFWLNIAGLAIGFAEMRGL